MTGVPTTEVAMSQSRSAVHRIAITAALALGLGLLGLPAGATAEDAAALPRDISVEPPASATEQLRNSADCCWLRVLFLPWECLLSFVPNC